MVSVANGKVGEGGAPSWEAVHTQERDLYAQWEAVDAGWELGSCRVGELRVAEEV